MITCQHCSHQNPDSARFCEECGTELHDPRRAAQEADEIEAEFRLDQVRKARSAFLVVGALQLLAGALGAVMAPPGAAMFVLGAEVVVALVFFGLAWWCKAQPFAAAIVGLFIYGGLHLMAAVGDPSTIYKGIIVKVIVIVVLVRAVKAGIAHRQFVRSRGMG
ncbi:MAG: zinc-ribbon domain-containing protein [Myxococcota bacterium]